MPGVIGGKPAPRHVYSAIVKNDTTHELLLKALYEMPHDGTDTFEVTLPPQGVVALPQKIISEGTCNLTGHIVNIAVTGPNVAIELKGPFNVASPTKDHPFIISASDEGVVMREGH